jgi:hypothetical protein
VIPELAPEPEPAAPVSATRSTFAPVAICFLLSEFAALLYETVWLRQFAIIPGTSQHALAVILASYLRVLAPLIRPGAETMLIVGLGGGLRPAQRRRN